MKEPPEGNMPFTYRKLREAINSMTEEELDQEVMLLPPTSGYEEPVRLEPGISIGTVEQMCHVDGEMCTETRDAKDFEHLPHQVVILRDRSPFSKQGDMAYEMTEDGKFVGDRTGLEFSFEDFDDDQDWEED